MIMENTYIYFFEERLYINLTNRCCNDCTFCIRNNMDGVDGNNLWLAEEGSKEEIVRQIAETGLNFDEAVFCGYGESTYRVDDMLFIADYLHSKGKKTRLDTNGLGSLINGYDLTERLVGYIDAVSISLNQADAKKYDEVTRSVYGEKAYDEMLDFAKKCVARKLDVVLTVVDVIPKEDIEKCKKITKELGAHFRVRSYIE